MALRRAAGIIGCAGVGSVAGLVTGVWVACETDGQDGLESGTLYGVLGGSLGAIAGAVIGLQARGS